MLTFCTYEIWHTIFIQFIFIFVLLYFTNILLFLIKLLQANLLTPLKRRCYILFFCLAEVMNSITTFGLTKWHGGYKIKKTQPCKNNSEPIIKKNNTVTLSKPRFFSFWFLLIAMLHYCQSRTLWWITINT